MKMLNNYVLVKPIPQEENKTSFGIILPMIEKRYDLAEVIETNNPSLDKGDIVYLIKGAGVNTGDGNLIIKEGDIIMIP